MDEIGSEAQSFIVRLWIEERAEGTSRSILLYLKDMGVRPKMS